MKNIILTIVLLCSITAAPVFAQNPFVPKYDAYKRSERCFTVTDAINKQFGSVWWADKIDFSQDTVFNFVVYMGSDDGGADGLAFVMHKDPRDTITDPNQQVIIGGAGTWNLSAATGDDGGGLGYAMHQSIVNQNTIPGPYGLGDDPENHKIQPSVAVEIDTYYNGDIQDGKEDLVNGIAASPYLGWDHTAVVYNGDLYGQQQTITDGNGNIGNILPLKPDYAFGAGNNNIEDDGCYTFQIRWDVLPDGTQDLELWVDTYDGSINTGGLSLVMTHNGDMINNVFGGDASGMRFGFTGSTGGLNNEQTICLLGENLAPFAADDYVFVPENTSKAIDIASNDNDPQNDQLHIPVLVKYPLKGQAVVFDSLLAGGTSKQFLRYTPNTNFTGNDSLAYVTCDINSTKCYAKCDTAYVYITVGCELDILVEVVSEQTSCDSTTPTGEFSSAVNVGGVPTTTGYAFNWYKGHNDIIPARDGYTGGPTADGLATDSYRLVVVQDITNCTAFVDTLIQDQTLLLPDITVVATDVTDCTAPNGTIAISTSGDPSDYSYALYEGPVVHVDNLLLTTNDLLISALTTGTYTVVAIDIISKCTSNPFSVTVNDISGVPIVNVIQENPDYACAGGNPTGILAPTVLGGSDADATVGNYTISWTETATGVTTITDNGGGIYADKAIDLAAGEYTVTVTDNAGLDAGCVTTQDYTVSSARHDIAITSSSTDQLACNPDGTAQVDGITEDGIATLLVDWNIFLLDAAMADITAVGSGIGLTGDPFNDLSGGTYYLQVQNDVTKCYSEPSAVIIDAAEGLPTATFMKSDQVSCDPANLSGQITAVPRVGLTSDYTYEWHIDDISGALVSADAGSNGEVISKLDAGNYMLRMESIATGCSNDYMLMVNSGIILPVISATAAASTECTPNENGSIDAEVLGVALPYNGYTFNWLKPLDGAWSSVGASITNLAPDEYIVTVTDDVTSCVSDPLLVTVADASICNNPLELTFTLSEEKAEIGTEVSMPVSVSGFDGIQSVQYTIEWDPALLEYQRAEFFGLGDLNSSSFNLTAPGILSLSWISGDGTGQSLADEQELFHLVFKAIGRGGDISDASFSSTQKPKEVIANGGEVTMVNYVTGKVSIYEMVELAGHIQTQHEEALEGIELELIGGMELNTTTDSNGRFSFMVRSHEEYHITPLFDTDSNDGVSTLDIAIMHWHILGQKQNIMSKYDQIAGDINGSKTLTAYDIAATRAVVIHSKDRPKDRNAVEFINDLDYVDAEDVFDYKNYLDIIPTRSHLYFDFTAVKLGDSRGDWKGNGNGNGARAQELDEIALILESELIVENKLIVPLKSQDFANMIGLQFTLEWNPEVVQFDQLREKQINLISNLDLVDQGLLTVTWNSKVEEGLSLDDRSILSAFEFTAIEASGDPDIKITSAITPARAYNSSLETIIIKGKLNIEQELMQHDLSIYPNPAADVLHVGGNMTIREYAIISSTGITIYSGELDASRQLNIKDLERGVYMLRGIGADDGVIYRKFIKK